MRNLMLAFALLMFEISAISAEALLIQQEVPWYSGDAEEESSEDSIISQYNLDLAITISVVGGAIGSAAGAFTIGYSCLGLPANINHGLCIAGITATSASAAWLVVGSLTTGALCIYKHYYYEQP